VWTRVPASLSAYLPLNFTPIVVCYCVCLYVVSQGSTENQFCWVDSLLTYYDYNYNYNKQRLVCWPAYRVNHWLDQPENWYVASFNIRGVPFGVRNECSKRQQRYKAKPNLGKNCAINFCVIEIHEFQPLSDKPHGGISWKWLKLSTIHCRELYLKEKKNKIKAQWVKIKCNYI